MILGLLYPIVRSLLDLLVLRRKTEAALQIEVLALRHQLLVLERQVHRPRFQAADRLLLSAISRLPPRPAWRSFLVGPETLLRWHRELVGWKWALYARRPPRGRPGPSPEHQELIVRLARENTRWGYRRIQVHRWHRRGLPKRGCGGHPIALSVASGELLRRKDG